MKTLLSILLAAALAIGAVGASAQEDRPYLPEFKALRSTLDGMSPLKAVQALQDYVVHHENPEGCELDEIDRLLAEREPKLVSLSISGKKIPAQVVYRCNEFDPKTAQCRSPWEDGTAHPMSTGIALMPTPEAGTPYRVAGRLPSAKPVGLYCASLADALDGKAATPVGNTGRGTWRVPAQAAALIAIYRTRGPWDYRKAVWYFE
jgi:hypothetical protein